MFHILCSAHHDNLGEGRGASALQQPHLLVGENRSSCTCHPKLSTLNTNCLGVRTMLLHCAKPGDSGTYRITITNSSGTASCSASLSVRSESQIFLSVDIITKVDLDVTGKTTSYTPTPTASHLSVPRSPYSSLGRSSSTSYSSSSNASYSSSYSTYNSSYSSGRGTTPYSSYRSYL